MTIHRKTRSASGAPSPSTVDPQAEPIARTCSSTTTRGSNRRWRAVVDLGVNPLAGKRIRKHLRADTKTELQAAVEQLLKQADS